MSFKYVQYTVEILKNIRRWEASRVELCLIFMIKKYLKHTIYLQRVRSYSLVFHLVGLENCECLRPRQIYPVIIYRNKGKIDSPIALHRPFQKPFALANKAFWDYIEGHVQTSAEILIRASSNCFPGLLQSLELGLLPEGWITASYYVCH